MVAELRLGPASGCAILHIGQWLPGCAHHTKDSGSQIETCFKLCHTADRIVALKVCHTAHGTVALRLGLPFCKAVVCSTWSSNAKA